MASTRSTRSTRAGFPSDPRHALPKLIDRYGPKLHSMALRICGNPADAEDALQEAFIDAFRGWRSFEGRADPGTWLYTIALRRCRAKIRSRRRRERLLVDASHVMPWREQVVTSVGASHDEPAMRSQRQEAVSRVQGEVSRLPEHLRVPLVLKEVVGLGIDDVAALLDLAPNTVKTRVHRGRLALRKAMLESVRTQQAPPPIYEKQICMDLLKAKMAALDRGAEVASRRLPSAELCARCRAVFRELDLVHDACAGLASDHLPPALRASILTAIRHHETSHRNRGTRRMGRPPVGRSMQRPQ